MFINCLVTFLPIGSHLFVERSLNKNHSICFFFSSADASVVSYISSCLPESQVIVYLDSHLQQARSLKKKRHLFISAFYRQSHDFISRGFNKKLKHTQRIVHSIQEKRSLKYHSLNGNFFLITQNDFLLLLIWPKHVLKKVSVHFQTSSTKTPTCCFKILLSLIVPRGNKATLRLPY